MTRRITAAVALALVLASCGGGSAPLTGTAADGQAIFASTVIGDNPGCTTCHSLKPGVVLVGPSLATIGVDGGGRVAGMTLGDYLHQSIVDPDAYVVEGFDAGRMPDDWSEQLSPDEISALVEYLSTLGQD